MATPDFSQRMLVARPMIGICHMQVCVEKDCSDEEILEFCNRENLAGTSNGWARVIREDEDWAGITLSGPDAPPEGVERALLSFELGGPVPCADHPDERLHILIAC